MAQEMIVGLYEDLGTAEDARNRLRYEGVPDSDVELHVINQIGPAPPWVALETHEWAVQFLKNSKAWTKYAPRIHNGETAAFVWFRTEDEAEIAINTLRQFAPMEVDRLSPSEEEWLLRQKAIATDAASA
jgi:hypothetical protein